MTIDYVLMDPTGNMTILVETPVPSAEQSACALTLMAQEPTAEQVGFLSAPAEGDCDTVLRMAGGEFCGNATMSAAVLYALRTDPDLKTVRVRVSGAETPVNVTLERSAEETYRCTADMPRPRSFGAYGDLPLVEMLGISHQISTAPMTRETAEKTVRAACAALGADGLGLMLLDEAAGTLTPLVYVPGADTLYWENSCASGTAATGAYLAHREKTPVFQGFAEPAGVLKVSAAPGGAVVLEGSVRLTHRGSMEYSFPQL